MVGNDIDADGKSLVMITGANQGGKSTFLRSVGVAQLMMQSGMFVGGESLRANVCEGVFTHYKREEDEALESGKLDEELARMSEIADHIAPELHAALQRVVRRDQRARGLGDRPAGHPGAAATPASGCCSSPTCSTWPTASRADGARRALFLRAERATDGSAPVQARRGRSRCRPATARTPTARSSARTSTAALGPDRLARAHACLRRARITGDHHRPALRRSTLIEELLSLSRRIARRPPCGVTCCRRAPRESPTDRFNLVVLGEFKRGKSTLINALLGRATPADRRGAADLGGDRDRDR